MAEILIKLEHADNPADPCAWDRCHPVCVKPDGWPWGSAERPPKFCVIRITDMTVAQVEPYLDVHVEPRPATRTWNRKRWEEAQVTGQYKEFVSVPVPGLVSDKTETITVDDKRYLEMIASENFDPFSYAPSFVKTMDVVVDIETLATERRYELTGVVSYIELTGDVPTILAVRRYKFDIDDVSIPKAVINSIENTGMVSVTKAQIVNFIKRNM